MRFSDVFIEAVATELPRTSLTTREIEARLTPLYARLGLKPGWLEVVTGIRARGVWDEGVSAYAMGTSAAERALRQAGVAPHEVGMLVSTAVAKEFLEPSVACQMHGGLGLPPSAWNFDIGNACLGFVTGMVMAGTAIQSGQVDVAVVVAAEDSRRPLKATLDRLLDPSANIETFKDNLATLTLGSAAVAMVLTSRRRARTPHRFLGGTLQSATQHNDLCFGGMEGMVTDSPRLLKEGVALAARTWQDFTAELGWRIDHIREFAMHQVGAAHHRTIRNTLGVPEERSLPVYAELGNIGAAGVPVTFALALEQGRFTVGDDVALMGIGSGLNCAMMGIRW